MHRMTRDAAGADVRALLSTERAFVSKTTRLFLAMQGPEARRPDRERPERRAYLSRHSRHRRPYAGGLCRHRRRSRGGGGSPSNLVRLGHGHASLPKEGLFGDGPRTRRRRRWPGVEPDLHLLPQHRSGNGSPPRRDRRPRRACVSGRRSGRVARRRAPDALARDRRRRLRRRRPPRVGPPRRFVVSRVGFGAGDRSPRRRRRPRRLRWAGARRGWNRMRSLPRGGPPACARPAHRDVVRSQGSLARPLATPRESGARGQSGLRCAATRCSFRVIPSPGKAAGATPARGEATSTPAKGATFSSAVAPGR